MGRRPKGEFGEGQPVLASKQMNWRTGVDGQLGQCTLDENAGLPLSVRMAMGMGMGMGVVNTR